MNQMLRLPKTLVKSFRQDTKMVQCITGSCQVGKEDTGSDTFREPQSCASRSGVVLKEPRNVSPNSTKKSTKGSRSSPQRSRTPSPTRKSPGASPRLTPRTTPRGSPRASPRASPKPSPSSSANVSPRPSRKGLLSSSPKWSTKNTPRATPKHTPSGSPIRSRSPSPRSPRLSPKRSRSRSASIKLSTSSLQSRRTIRPKRSNRSVANPLDELKFSTKQALNEVITQLNPPERCIVINKLSNTDIRITKYDTNDNSSLGSFDFGSSSQSDSDSIDASQLPILRIKDSPDKIPRVTKKDSPWRGVGKSVPERLMKFTVPEKTSNYFLESQRKAGSRPPRSLSPSPTRAMDLPPDSTKRPPSFEVKVTVETASKKGVENEESAAELSASAAESETQFSRSDDLMEEAAVAVATGVVVATKPWMRGANKKVKKTTRAPKSLLDDPLISIYPEDERLRTVSRLQCFVEERRRNGQYTAVCLVMVAALMGLYHAFRAQNAVLAGFLVPALIMLLYLLWVLYSAQRARVKQMQLARALGEVTTEDADAEAEMEDSERRRKKKHKQENGDAKKTRGRSPTPTRRGSPVRKHDIPTVVVKAPTPVRDME